MSKSQTKKFVSKLGWEHPEPDRCFYTGLKLNMSRLAAQDEALRATAEHLIPRAILPQFVAKYVEKNVVPCAMFINGRIGNAPLHIKFSVKQILYRTPDHPETIGWYSNYLDMILKPFLLPDKKVHCWGYRGIPMADQDAAFDQYLETLSPEEKALFKMALIERATKGKKLLTCEIKLLLADHEKLIQKFQLTKVNVSNIIQSRKRVA